MSGVLYVFVLLVRCALGAVVSSRSQLCICELGIYSDAN